MGAPVSRAAAWAASGLRVNLGCGSNHLDGYVNVDSEPACVPDRLVDLECTPWPFPENSVMELRMSHVLEHLGATTEAYFKIIQEVYRVCQDGALVHIKVPHPRHDNYLADPTHVRPITLGGLAMFSKAKNLEWQQQGYSNTPLGLNLDVDFEIVDFKNVLDPLWQRKLDNGEVSMEALQLAMRSQFNVIEEICCTLRVIKASQAPTGENPVS